VDFLRELEVPVTGEFVRGVNTRAAWLQGKEVVNLCYSRCVTAAEFAQLVVRLIGDHTIALLDPGAVDFLVEAAQAREGMSDEERVAFLRDCVEAAGLHSEKRGLVLAAVRGLRKPHLKDRLLELVGAPR
jgi:hypothetical protein